MMTDFIDDVMGFNPTDLNVFNAPEATDFNQNVYKTNPKESNETLFFHYNVPKN